jgi:peptidylprolyl isomerase
MSTNEKPSVEIPADDPPDDLLIEDLTLGDGDEAVAGRNVMVHYVGVAWSNGRQFDASWDRGDSFDFRLGAGQVITGWDRGGRHEGGRSVAASRSFRRYLGHGWAPEV